MSHIGIELGKTIEDTLRETVQWAQRDLRAVVGKYAFWIRYNSGTRPDIDPPISLISH